MPRIPGSWYHLEPITSERMEAIWKVAHEKGYRDLKSFWEYVHRQRWDFYDVIRIASPTA